jgi:hypothetical protein
MFSSIKKFILFLLPLGLLFIFPVFVFVASKEYYSPEQALLFQQKNPKTIVGFAYSGDSATFKELLVTKKNPAVFSLGTSRVGEFRKEFFHDSEQFVTASNAISSIDDMKTFVEKLPSNNQQKILILGLDQNMFWSSRSKESKRQSNFERMKKFFLIEWKEPYLDYFSGKFSPKELWKKSANSKNIGLSGIIKNDGFRNDGSYQYSTLLTVKEREKTLKVSIDALVTMFQKERSSSDFKEPVSKKALSSLNELLMLCKKRNIHVIGFLPPYPSVTYHELIRVDDIYKERMLQLPKIAKKVFSDYGFTFFDFSDSTILGEHDNEFVDSAHATDKYYLRMTIFMAKKDKQLEKYVDIQKAQQLLKNTENDFMNN